MLANRVLEIFALTAVSLFAFYRGLQPLVFHVPHANELSFHQMLTNRVLESGLGWVPHGGSGAAVLRYYPHLVHILSAGVASVMIAVFPSRTTNVDDAVVFVNAVLLMLVPVAAWFCCRRLGLRNSASSMAAISTFFVRTAPELGLSGLQFSTYTWDGAGLMSQLAGVVVGFGALGMSAPYVAFGTGSLVAASLSLSLTWMANFQMGYGITVLLLACLAFGENSCVRRFMAVSLCVAGATSYIWLAAVVERSVISRTAVEPALFWNSIGLEDLAAAFFRGSVLDYTASGDAFPFLTVFLAVGLVWMASRAAFHVLREQPIHRSDLLILVLLITSLGLASGRPLLGKFANLLPFSRSFVPFSRFFVLFQMIAVVVIGWALGEAANVVAKITARFDSSSRRPMKTFFVFLVICGLVVSSYSPLTSQSLEVREKLHAQHIDLHGWWGQPLFELLNETALEVVKAPGRAYAGAAWNWGQHFDVKYVKLFNLWTARGINVPNIGQLWHSLSLNSLADMWFDERRSDHRQLFNLRYVVCQADRLPEPYRKVSSDKVSHAVHEWTSATGYFDFAQISSCHDAWNETEAAFLAWRRDFVNSSDTHWFKLHPRVALSRSERCSPYERIDVKIPSGQITEQRGNTDKFEATIDCRELRGCSVIVRVSYHPNFVVSSSSRKFKSMCVAPAFLSFIVPFGTDVYTVQYETPLWSKVQTAVCFLGMVAMLVSLFGVRLALPLMKMKRA